MLAVVLVVVLVVVVPDPAVNGKRKKSNALRYLNLFDVYLYVLSCEIRRFKPAQNCFSSSNLFLTYVLVLFIK